MSDEEFFSVPRRIWLQSIRRKIADANGIVYMQAPEHDKDCDGDCKACRAEIRYIDSELSRKAKQGEEINMLSVLSDILLDFEVEKDSALNLVKESIENEDAKRSKTADEKEVATEETIILVEDLGLSVHLENCVKQYGINNTEELYILLRDDSDNMKKKLRGGYRFLEEKLKELGYEL